MFWMSVRVTPPLRLQMVRPTFYCWSHKRCNKPRPAHSGILDLIGQCHTQTTPIGPISNCKYKQLVYQPKQLKCVVCDLFWEKHTYILHVPTYCDTRNLWKPHKKNKKNKKNNHNQADTLSRNYDIQSHTYDTLRRDFNGKSRSYDILTHNCDINIMKTS